MILENEVNNFMKKIVIAVLAGVMLLSGLVYFKITHPSISKKVENLQENMTSYHLEAVMKMLDGEDLRNFNVKVSYLKDG